MFDLGWIELLFVSTLALIIVGPKDLPKLLRLGGYLLAKVKRFYTDLLGSVNQLEREIDIASGNADSDLGWQALVPEHARQLPEDFLPGSLSAEQHQQRRQAIDKAKQEWQQQQTNTSANN